MCLRRFLTPDSRQYDLLRVLRAAWVMVTSALLSPVTSSIWGMRYLEAMASFSSAT